MKTNIVLFILLLLSQTTFCENTQIEEPLYWEFYQEQKIIETPNVEYEDFEIYSPETVSAEIKKYDITQYILSLPTVTPVNTHIFLGNNIFSTGISSQRIFPGKKFNLSFLADTKNVKFNQEDKILTKLDCAGSYSKIFNKTVFSIDAGIYSYIFDTDTNRCNISLQLNTFSGEKIELFYRPEINFINKLSSGFNYVYLFQDAGVAFIPYYNSYFAFVINSVLLDTQTVNLYGVTCRLKNLLFGNNSFRIRLLIPIDTSLLYKENFYYSIIAQQNISKIKFGLSLEKKLFHEYVKNYFIMYPKIEINKNVTTELSYSNGYTITFSYKEKKLEFTVGWKNLDYNFFPTYIVNSQNLIPYSIQKVKISSLYINFMIPIFTLEALKFYGGSEYLINAENILFYPRFKYSLGFNSEFKKLYLKIAVEGNDDIPINYDSFVEKSCVGMFETGFCLTNEISINILYNFILQGKNYLQPFIYLDPSVMLGFKVKF